MKSAAERSILLKSNLSSSGDASYLRGYNVEVLVIIKVRTRVDEKRRYANQNGFAINSVDY